MKWKPKTQRGARKQLIKKVRKQWGIKLKSHRSFNKKTYKLMGAGTHKGIGKKKSPKSSYRTIKRRTQDGGILYATYKYGKD